jgi:hypothetical protein
MSLDWDQVLGFALSLPGAELSTSYGKPAAKANGRAFISPGREDPDRVRAMIGQAKDWCESRPRLRPHKKT